MLSWFHESCCIFFPNNPDVDALCDYVILFIMWPSHHTRLVSAREGKTPGSLTEAAWCASSADKRQKHSASQCRTWGYPKHVPKMSKKSGYPATNWFAYSRSTFLDGATILLQKCERFPHVLVRKRWLFARHEFCLVQRHVHSVTRVIPIKSIAGIAGLRLKQLFLIIRAEFAALAADFEKACLCSSS